MKNRDIENPVERTINFHRHLQHGWRRSPFLLTVAMRMKHNKYSRAVVSSPTSPDDELPEQRNN